GHDDRGIRVATSGGRFGHGTVLLSLKGAKNRGLEFWAEAANRSQLARFRRALQRWAIADLQGIRQQLDPFWPKPGAGTQFEQSARNLFQQLSMNLQLIAPHQRFDLAGEVGAEAGQLLNLLDRQIGYAGWVFSDGARGVAVSAHAEEIAPAYLEQVGDLIQD